MAKLLPPTVGERLARCGTKIEVWGIMPNSEVDLDIDGTQQTVLVSGTSNSFTVPPMKDGAHVSARQRLGPDKSDWSNKVKVEDVLLPPPPSRTEPSIIRCAHCIGAFSLLFDPPLIFDYSAIFDPPVVMGASSLEHRGYRDCGSKETISY